jgi:hypothetical protein
MMNNKMNKPARFTGEMYGLKVVVEHEYSDVSLDEVMDAFETILTGMGYHPDALKDWIVERAEEYKEEDTQSENDGDWDVTLNDGLEDEDDYIVNAEWAVVDVINKLKQIEVDGEIMQYILEEVGLDEQMAIQLATMYPDVVEEHLAELKDEDQPTISDDFQIGPDGAYEHEDEYNVDEVVEAANEDEEIARAFENFFKTMKAARKNGK